jgi:hypothetical protein
MPRSGTKAGEVVETGCTRLAPVSLAMQLRVVAPISDHRGTAAPGAAHPLWPAMLAHEGEALGVIHQAQDVDQVQCGHDGEISSHEAGIARSSSDQGSVRHAIQAQKPPPRNRTRASQESPRVLAKRHGINPKTIAKWKQRTSVTDHPTGSKQSHSIVLSVEEEAVVVAFRRHTPGRSSTMRRLSGKWKQSQTAWLMILAENR